MTLSILSLFAERLATPSLHLDKTESFYFLTVFAVLTSLPFD